MSQTTAEQASVVYTTALRLIATVSFTLHTVVFVVRQRSKYAGDLSRLLRNKFVVGILLLSVNAILCELSSVMYAMVFRVMLSSKDIGFARYLGFMRTSPELISMACHVALLSMRVAFILKQIGKKVVLPIKVLLACFVVSGPIAFVSTSTTMLSGWQEGAALVLMYSSCALYILCLSLLDIVSTAFFWRYVSETHKNLGPSLGHVTSARSTQVIAQIGVAISLISLLGSVFYDCGALGAGGPDVLEWIWLGTSCCVMGVGALWILMKSRLDELKQCATIDKSTTSSLQNIGSTTATTTTKTGTTTPL